MFCWLFFFGWWFFHLWLDICISNWSILCWGQLIAATGCLGGWIIFGSFEYFFSLFNQSGGLMDICNLSSLLLLCWNWMVWGECISYWSTCSRFSISRCTGSQCLFVLFFWRSKRFMNRRFIIWNLIVLWFSFAWKFTQWYMLGFFFSFFLLLSFFFLCLLSFLLHSLHPFFNSLITFLFLLLKCFFIKA